MSQRFEWKEFLTMANGQRRQGPNVLVVFLGVVAVLAGTAFLLYRAGAFS